jgi:hypothetical protein
MATAYAHLPLLERILSFADAKIREIEEERGELENERDLLRAILNQEACRRDKVIEASLSDRLIEIEAKWIALGQELDTWREIRRAQGRNCVVCGGYGKLTEYICEDQTATVVCGGCGGTGITPKQ